jgi:hypothetical protein
VFGDDTANADGDAVGSVGDCAMAPSIPSGALISPSLQFDSGQRFILREIRRMSFAALLVPCSPPPPCFPPLTTIHQLIFPRRRVRRFVFVSIRLLNVCL